MVKDINSIKILYNWKAYSFSFQDMQLFFLKCFSTPFYRPRKEKIPRHICCFRIFVIQASLPSSTVMRLGHREEPTRYALLPGKYIVHLEQWAGCGLNGGGGPEKVRRPFLILFQCFIS